MRRGALGGGARWRRSVAALGGGARRVCGGGKGIRSAVVAACWHWWAAVAVAVATRAAKNGAVTGLATGAVLGGGVCGSGEGIGWAAAAAWRTWWRRCCFLGKYWRLSAAISSSAAWRAAMAANSAASSFAPRCLASCTRSVPSVAGGGAGSTCAAASAAFPASAAARQPVCFVLRRSCNSHRHASSVVRELPLVSCTAGSMDLPQPPCSAWPVWHRRNAWKPPFVALLSFSCDSRRTTGSASIRRTCSWIAAASGASSGRKSTVSTASIRSTI